jgi:hypothetical protein
VVSATPTTPRSKHYVWFHPQLIKGVNALGSTMVTPIQVKDLAKGYNEDPWFKDVLNLQPLLSHKGLSWKDGKLVVPNVASIKEKILHRCHNSSYAGYIGRNKTYDLVARSYWWQGIRQGVTLYCRSCDSCQRVKYYNQKAAGLYQPSPLPKKQWSTVTMDLTMQLPPATDGNTAIIVFCDKFTKVIHVVLDKTKSDGPEVANLFFRYVFQYHGMPEHFIHDRDTRFTSQFWKALFGFCGIK